MSSGNPFRTSQAFHQPPSIPQASFINTDISVPKARRGESDYVLENAASPPPKTKKSVRIVSPTTTISPHPDFGHEDVTLNELMAKRSSQGPLSSPPPPVTPAGFANNSITASEANAQVVGNDAMATADILPNSSSLHNRPQAALSPGRVPPNPFAKTLASLESQEKEGATEERKSAQRPSPGNNRASLDVESFKNLLLTGRPTRRPSGSSAQPTSAGGAHLESSSSTDTSSISRQSIFEHPQEIHDESPQTSVDTLESDEDDRMGVVSEANKGKKKPPPTPKHRHGKLVTQRQPQIVSFDSFTATEPAFPPVIRRADSSDTSKPLPPAPAIPQSPRINTQETTPIQSPPIRPTQGDSPTTSQGQTRPKKTPPPVPLARRQSQLKTSTTGSRARSSSNLTISSQHSVDGLQSPVPSNYDHSPGAGARSPPAPPPSRRGARLANLGDSSANSSSTELPQRAASIRTPRSVPETIPSPRQSTQESEPPSPAPSIHRSSSISSTRRAPRNVSGGSTGSTMPPPPPPRRRQSNRSSLDQPRPYVPSSSSPTESRRTSTEYRRSSTEIRRTSVASDRRSYATVDEKAENEYALYSPNEEIEKRLGSSGDENAGVNSSGGGKESMGIEARSDSSNILDDMEKFQREIDALRVKFKQAG
ncbi:hypothetical protein PtrSN002B_002719 [Pyrenophora tritici-repentis]|uniref:Uncharacterized protein n=3 Tax=Pyrenophora tritici-repentis TaxID=45151 RepID=A0A2W1HWY5_9PLEO|nr:uncharacterized protein PTRG_06425 [Pyrenophora tritici-repentis Pt-1C-BFP]KAG9380393.1 hypothetical protein A1F94_009288 [Pyrenophora tritici-repentis]EDU49345.1 predicted protein [Pyrenophora tritici-repentis Pt-1C-BFP]KAI0584700.1 hypothetical protein Alg215_02937 [Pyrenophora tritici-repentis]KAI1512537.1 hypothetical protein Ptr86124_008503 [Pyrenophora tritici-repentis]KAI1543497.1 hypothetical protein PtrSN001A_003076 [Pyrenophora tritici-repentis]